MNKNIIAVFIGVVVIGAGSFYSGLKYGESNTVATVISSGRNFGQLGAGGSAFNGGGGRGTRGGGGFTAGEILAKDDKSLTLKLRDGGSKIIFLTASTSVMKISSGSLEDLSVGTDITINGSANQDGSVSAESIQIRPKF